MGMRITTSMMMNTYRYNLQGSTSNLSSAREKVLSQRKFTSYSEDPAAATQAWRIRRAMSSNFDYQANNSDTYSRFNIAWATMGVVNNKLVDVVGRVSTIRGENGAIGAGRQPLGQVLSETAETIVQAMNSAKYGDHFVFAGNDEMNAPFSWSDDMQTLYYRGINVGAGAVERPTMEPSWTSNPTKPSWADNPIDENTGVPEGMPSSTDAGLSDWEKEWAEYYEDQAKIANNDPTARNLQKPDEVLKDMPEIADAADEWEEAWIQYYTDQAKVAKNDPNDPAKGIAKPEEVPAWTNSKLDENGIPEGAPTGDAVSAWDQKWLDYFDALKTDKNTPKPTLDPSETDPDTWGEKDQFGIPKNAKDIAENAEGNYSETDVAWAKYLLDQGDVAKLDYLAKEEQNVDLGMGLQEDASSILINGTAFDRSLPGINMLGGYGVDEDGDPKNVVLIMKRIGELFSSSDPDSGAWANPGDEEEAMRLLDKLNAAHDRTTESYTEIDTRAQFLQQNQTRLETQGDYLQEERVNIEQVDLADALTEFSWDYYCYSAALKIGTQLLSQSLLDYMS